ncbi:hypothetical protein GUH67_16960, partial [Xanthomonas citri pv. citri]|nr:hypothetical protein [Xanthomonas citri pv. citri]
RKRAINGNDRYIDIGRREEVDGRANAFEARRHVERIGTVPFEDDGGQIEMMGDLTRSKKWRRF